jgi:DNA-binding GntR family transcriptional regulator
MRIPMALRFGASADCTKLEIGARERHLRSNGTRSLVDITHDQLHRQITDGKLVDGQRLIIDQLAREFKTSLIPVREALARLHAEGLVWFERNKGYRVAPAPTTDQLRTLFESRLIIETGAAELAMGRLDRAAVEELREINRQLMGSSYGKTFKSSRRFVTLNERFHVGLVELAGNPSLSNAYRHLGFHQLITRPTFDHGVGDVRRIVREHSDIIDALVAQDLDSLRMAIRTHIANGLTFLHRGLKDSCIPELSSVGQPHGSAPPVQLSSSPLKRPRARGI